MSLSLLVKKLHHESSIMNNMLQTCATRTRAASTTSACAERATWATGTAACRTRTTVWSTRASATRTPSATSAAAAAASPALLVRPKSSFESHKLVSACVPGNGFTKCVAEAPHVRCGLSDSPPCHRDADCVDQRCRCRSGFVGDGIWCAANASDCSLVPALCHVNAACTGTGYVTVS